jgi:hypothetical protein
MGFWFVGIYGGIEGVRGHVFKHTLFVLRTENSRKR